MGTQRQKEVLERLAAGRVMQGDMQRLQDVGWTMTDASLCGLGQTAAGAVLSAIKLWPDMFAVDTHPIAPRSSAARKRGTKSAGARHAKSVAVPRKATRRPSAPKKSRTTGKAQGSKSNAKRK